MHATNTLVHVSDTKDRGLLYWSGVFEQLIGYMDVDWAKNVSEDRSTSGFAFSLEAPRLLGAARSNR